MSRSSSFKQDFLEHGYVIIPHLIAPEDLEPLREAASRVTARTRDGEWPHRRVVGRQFPPYGNDGDDSWGVQHVMHPDLKEPVFAKWYASDRLVAAIEELLGCNEEEIQIGE
jgi:hypothetical protein